MTDGKSTDITAAIGPELPFLRRYARALTGSQGTGDRYAVATLEAILADRSMFEGDLPPRVALFRAFHAIWSSAGAPVAEGGTDALEARAQVHLSNLTRNTREALLLRTIEEMRFDQIAQIMDVTQSEAEELVTIAMNEMERTVLGHVMIIEDETIIAMDIQSIVQSMGHRVTGIARTREQAVALSRKERPNLVLADIQLADNSSGVDAVNDILAELGDIPVIFITAFPERLLTGERPEPAFLISKPYLEEQVRSAVSQAMFFASTETLAA
ncbi:response regulator [Frigidibacter albus]|uniref:Response regulator n=1 Tax=Frigidibacter albus TaxID=1465486 RepID=A0A6L8VGM4_9RHOB|nr:response regulator [Frigidibacter albus]MZQ89538.1 response regulator [Frigidibacter albus]NBE31444.1 response regulator [Frigidibacter albus]GGH55428.1 two-component response regulator [Frigidibacter albus]